MTELGIDVTWLSLEDHDRLAAELEYLTGPGRIEITSRIQQAREEGDLRENGGYHAAKEEQGKQEVRIRQLELLLRSAQVGEAPTAADRVQPGTVVTLRYDGDDPPERYLLGSREDSGAPGLEILSVAGPVGQAILGKQPGDQARYTTPSGANVGVTILEIQPFAVG